VLGWVGAWGDGLWTCGGLGEDLWRWALPCLDWRAQEGVCFGRRLMCVKVRRGIQEVRMGQEIVILDDFVQGKGGCEFMVPMYVPHYP
jgi:hypothetical protein